MGSSVFISSIVSNNSLEELHGKEVRVISIRSVEKHTNVEVFHFVISDIHDAGSEKWFFRIGDIDRSNV